MQRLNSKFFAGFLFAAVLLNTATGRCITAELSAADHDSPHRIDNCDGGSGSGGGTRSPVSGSAAASSAQVAQMTDLILKSGITPEATKGSWSCGSSSGDGKGCGLVLGKYILGSAKACASCVGSFLGGDTKSQGSNVESFDVPINGEDRTIAKGDLSKCSGCAAALRKAPKCGGTVFGIGSQKRARSCKLIDEAGCWPDSSRKVLHDCGAGNECAYKVTGAKAKIWCCARKKSGFWNVVHNLLRCTSRAYSKSKDRDGAVILFE